MIAPVGTGAKTGTSTGSGKSSNPVEGIVLPAEATMLAALPPSNWRCARRRIAELARYEALVDATGDDLRSAAARLDLTERSFYRLLLAYRLARDRGLAPESRRGAHGHISHLAEETIATVRQEFGREATDAAIAREVARRCEMLSIDAPSMTAVRNRTGAARGSVDLQSRLGSDADRMIDSWRQAVRGRTNATMRARTPEEARRRLGVVDRYLAIASPTAADDERFAEELGLSTDSLIRLARARRVVGRGGSVSRGGEEDARGLALRAAADPDMTKVSPSRRLLVRRRLAAIREHLSAAGPTKEATARHAALADMPPATFSRMVNLWMETREPSLLPGASEPVRRGRRKNPTVSPAADAHVAAAIAKLGTDATSLAIHWESTRLCEADGVKAPAKSTVYHRLMRARAESPPAADGATGLAVDHCALAIAVSNGGLAQMPVLTLAFEQASGRILHHVLSLASPTALVATEAVLGALRASPSTGGCAPVLVSLPEAHEREKLLSTLRAHGVVAPTGPHGHFVVGSLVGRAFGDLVGGIRLRPRATRNPRGAALTRVMGRDAALPLGEAEAAIADAVALHNRCRTASSGFPVDGARRDDLAAALSALLRQD